MYQRKPNHALPGFKATMGFTLVYLFLIVVFPLLGLGIKASGIGWTRFHEIVTSERVIASLELSFGASLVAAGINVILGFVVAWVLVRYKFAGKRILDALVDIPFALPTAVAGIALTTLYSAKGWLGGLLAPLGIKAAYTPLGIIVALSFVSLPLVVRSVQPVLEEFDPEVEEAAAVLGAHRGQRFMRVLLPELAPAILTGFALSMARAVGEYGSVVFISGNLPLRTEIAPLLIISKLEQYDYAGATAIAAIMLVFSFSILLGINLSQYWRRHRITPALP
ncbi:MAG TPA: sulfate ABC transporter permease subunit CysT [Candidatus Angelobacter sp.]|jgi:sulfate transport system permease protein|nr:sulfate ABC transporter permease subunit CysT [Candidatus Angelobacter sp.]